MKNVFISLLLLVGPVAFADYQLVCRHNLSSTEQKIEIFELRGANQSFAQVRQVIYTKQISQILDNPYSSVSNQDELPQPKFELAKYLVLNVQSAVDNESFFIKLTSGGSLSFKLNFTSALWDGHFIRPNGPEMPQIFSDCTLENPEIGFTARN